MSEPAVQIRALRRRDVPAILDIVEPVVRAGETYAVSPSLTRSEITDWWCGPAHEVRVAVVGDQIVGSYYLRANQQGPGSHVANCGYITSATFEGQGIARQMCSDSLVVARERGFLAMQYNLVAASNLRAVRLWQDMGFAEVGRIPQAFRLPTGQRVDALVLFRSLE